MKLGHNLESPSRQNILTISFPAIIVRRNSAIKAEFTETMAKKPAMNKKTIICHEMMDGMEKMFLDLNLPSNYSYMELSFQFNTETF